MRKSFSQMSSESMVDRSSTSRGSFTWLGWTEGPKQEPISASNLPIYHYLPCLTSEHCLNPFCQFLVVVVA